MRLLLTEFAAYFADGFIIESTTDDEEIKNVCNKVKPLLQDALGLYLERIFPGSNSVDMWDTSLGKPLVNEDEIISPSKSNSTKTNAASQPPQAPAQARADGDVQAQIEKISAALEEVRRAVPEYDPLVKDPEEAVRLGKGDCSANAKLFQQKMEALGFKSETQSQTIGLMIDGVLVSAGHAINIVSLSDGRKLIVDVLGFLTKGVWRRMFFLEEEYFQGIATIYAPFEKLILSDGSRLFLSEDEKKTIVKEWIKSLIRIPSRYRREMAKLAEEHGEDIAGEYNEYIQEYFGRNFSTKLLSRQALGEFNAGLLRKKANLPVYRFGDTIIIEKEFYESEVLSRSAYQKNILADIIEVSDVVSDYLGEGAQTEDALERFAQERVESVYKEAKARDVQLKESLTRAASAHVQSSHERRRKSFRSVAKPLVQEEPLLRYKTAAILSAEEMISNEPQIYEELSQKGIVGSGIISIKVSEEELEGLRLGSIDIIKLVKSRIGERKIDLLVNNTPVADLGAALSINLGCGLILTFEELKELDGPKLYEKIIEASV